MNWSKLIGILLIIIGVLLGAYIGIRLLLIGGILNIISFIKTDYETNVLLLKGVVKIMLSTPVGSIIFWVFSLIGVTLITDY